MGICKLWARLGQYKYRPNLGLSKIFKQIEILFKTE